MYRPLEVVRVILPLELVLLSEEDALTQHLDLIPVFQEGLGMFVEVQDLLLVVVLPQTAEMPDVLFSVMLLVEVFHLQTLTPLWYKLEVLLLE
jgi:hypothetical protein